MNYHFYKIIYVLFASFGISFVQAAESPYQESITPFEWVDAAGENYYDVFPACASGITARSMIVTDAGHKGKNRSRLETIPEEGTVGSGFIRIKLATKKINPQPIRKPDILEVMENGKVACPTIAYLQKNPL